MAIEKVRDYFKQFGMEDRIIEPEESSATVELAAKALGTEPRRIAKSMSFIVDDKPIIIVMAGDAKADNRKFKDQFHQKATMIPFGEVEAAVGHAAGGVCPFAIKDDVTVYLDDSLRRFKTIFPACGSGNSAIELTCDELQKYSQNFKAWINVSKGWQDDRM